MEKCIYDCFALRGTNEALFQSNKSRQINPNMSRQIQTASVTTRFKHINSDRSIPTKDVPILRLTSRKVSIVSIKTDLSRRFPARTWPVLPPVSFNRINPNRSIPTLLQRQMQIQIVTLVSIVSIQTDQSRQNTCILLSHS